MQAFDGDLVQSSRSSAAAVRRRLNRGDLREITRGLYTRNQSDPLDRVVLDNQVRILGMYYPAAVITDRSARTGRAVEGVLYVAHPRERELELPGLRIEPRRGAGAVAGDVPLPEGVYLASPARALLENARPTRPRKSGPPRTLTRDELERWIEEILVRQGEERLKTVRRSMEEVAPVLDMERELNIVNPLFDAALRSRAPGEAFDAARLVLMERLVAALLERAPRVVSADPAEVRWRFLPFFEAYFSNFIEGTEFTVDEAAEIALEHVERPDRPEDAHDIAGTYQIVSDVAEMSRTPTSSAQFLELLSARHRVLMKARPDKSPGRFKTLANRAGPTQFVAPDAVEGTLTRGFYAMSPLSDPFARAVAMTFLVAEVHPFADGNGRIARIMMNAELVAGRQQRIIVPIVYRQEYLGGLRALTHNSRPSSVISVLEFAQRFTQAADFSSLKGAEQQLIEANAFVDPLDAERENIKLRLPG
jgi:fido (protein-threonine AMPylation protein)/PAS domain-containing protein